MSALHYRAGVCVAVPEAVTAWFSTVFVTELVVPGLHVFVCADKE